MTVQRRNMISAATLLAILTGDSSSSRDFMAHAFVVPASSYIAPTSRHDVITMQPRAVYNLRSSLNFILHYAVTTSDEELVQDVSSMKAKEIRQELESYGVPTQSFFEKRELVDALVQARREGMAPIDTDGVSDNADDVAASSTKGGSSTSHKVAANRQDKIREEMDKCKDMKVKELKKELESHGVSTKSYFEKTEFIRAVAEARVDGAKKSPGWKWPWTKGDDEGSSSNWGKVEEEPFDPSFRDVACVKFTGDGGLLSGVIDVTNKA